MKKTVTLTAIAMLIATTGEADTDGRFKFSDLFERGGWSPQAGDDDDDDRLGWYSDRGDERGDDDDDDKDDRRSEDRSDDD
ncbi:hypothetical protein KUV51_14720 [Tateyamaria omphalii]|uniref:hypothetical protein n=1 Tax=Tateyamaria omphalii TaxID=299262 RepID=UPI001C99A0C0|nr:hypothetical protein [Tateyamaria omphalii]MBY5934260.1 hypothetical protein [Tateyamaria omphalii]